MGAGKEDLIFIWLEGGGNGGNGNLDGGEKIAVGWFFGRHGFSIALEGYNR